ncbi:hypothetical protein Tco_1218506 [Tanacetum coccineum]
MFTILDDADLARWGEGIGWFAVPCWLCVVNGKKAQGKRGREKKSRPPEDTLRRGTTQVHRVIWGNEESLKKKEEIKEREEEEEEDERHARKIPKKEKEKREEV